ncbi:hypothetical protein [Sphingomonas sp. OK281]|uniref:hypothetical protein n=1 Tax=Sphingomonas sp. OK281 TaxID=1881067 RepID=UPI0008F17EAF|nr:hypothetical protein [Sphingomonas sp. OK281]SFN86208.1 beta-glucosidase [Sphingomonas sp. OK281]
MIRFAKPLLIGTAGLGLVLGGTAPAIAQTNTTYRDGAVASDADARANAIVQQMTLGEKIAMVHGTFGSTILKTSPTEKRNGAGHADIGRA